MFTTSIASAFRKTLRFLGMANTTAPTAPETISEEGCNVDLYLSNLRNGYGFGAARMDECTVSELHLCKEQTNIGHEYISAKVLRAGEDIPFYIHFERFRGAPDSDKPAPSTEGVPADPRAMESVPAETRAEGRPSLSPGRLSTIMQASSDGVIHAAKASSESVAYSEDVSKDISPFFKDHAAKDKAYMRKTATKSGLDWERCRTVKFGAPIPFYKIAVLAGTVHRSRQLYALNGGSNCYFYSGTIMRVIEAVYADQIRSASNVNDFEAEEDLSRAESESGGPKQVRKKAGRVPLFRKTPLFLVYSLGNADITPIVESYNVDLQQFVNQAQSRDIEASNGRAEREYLARQLDEQTARAERAEAQLAKLVEQPNTHGSTFI